MTPEQQLSAAQRSYDAQEDPRYLENPTPEPKMDYRPLATTFTESEFTYTQEDRQGDLAIYRQQKGQQEPRWEVIVIVRHDGYERGGKQIPPAETYPSPKQWGTRGWTCWTRAAADAKISELKAERFNNPK